jgi:hypothetical protein
MTRRIQKKDPEAKLFFRNQKLNAILLIKDTVPEQDRRPGMPFVGTKLYFPFNEENIYEGGRTLFLHEKAAEKAIIDHFGESAFDKALFEEDVRIMRLLDSLPSLDPFLMKDIFLRQKMPMNEAYFEVSEEAWNEIETFMLQRFETLVRAAFPESETTDEKARLLIDKIWEARDMDALQPLILAFRLPQANALDIFSSWRGIVYYSYQYQSEQVKMMELIRWLKDANHPYTGVPGADSKAVQDQLTFVTERLRGEWQKIETIVRDYEDSYNKMFLEKSSSTKFLEFLRGSNETYWTLGNCLGKTNHAIYCWDATTTRYEARNLPWAQMQSMAKLLVTIFEPEKKATTNVAWN